MRQRHDSTRIRAVREVALHRPGGRNRPCKHPSRLIGDMGSSHERCPRLPWQRGVSLVIDSERDNQRAPRD